MTATLTPAEARLRARRGAEALDECAPGWVHEVDASTFQLTDGQYCVLGQAARYVLVAVGAGVGPYEEECCGDDYGTVLDYAGQDFCVAPEDYGFVAESGDTEDWAMLQCAWLEILAERGAVPVPA